MARNERDRIFSTGERDLAGEQETGRGAGGRGTGERDLAGEQETGRGAGGRGTGERDLAGEQVCCLSTGIAKNLLPSCTS